MVLCRMVVMFMVIHYQTRIPESGKEEGGHKTNEVVTPSPPNNGAVDGIVGRDKESCGEIGLNQHMYIRPRGVPQHLYGQQRPR